LSAGSFQVECESLPRHQGRLHPNEIYDQFTNPFGAAQGSSANTKQASESQTILKIQEPSNQHRTRGKARHFARHF
jgi:hypothetical protein